MTLRAVRKNSTVAKVFGRTKRSVIESEQDIRLLVKVRPIVIFLGCLVMSNWCANICLFH